VKRRDATPLTSASIAPPQLVRAWHRLLRECVAHARQMGVAEPEIYIETESGVCVMNGEHHDERSCGRQDRIVFYLPWPRDVRPDLGSW